MMLIAFSISSLPKSTDAEMRSLASSMFFTVMRDKEGDGPVRLKRIWNEVEELSDSINQGYVKVLDLVRTLEEEAGIVLR